MTKGAAKAKKEPTEYVVLQKVEGHDDAWMPVARVKAHAPRDAARLGARLDPPEDGAEFREGDFRAVPARSWAAAANLSIKNEHRVVPLFTEPGAQAEGGARGAEKQPEREAPRA